MERLQKTKAAEVFRFFEEICRIPHGSGNIGQISDYLAGFARERHLQYVQDDVKNIIIIKEATPGYEQEEPILLQGHMDMVAVKKPDCPKDMKTQGLDLCTEGDWLYAQGTSLGGDDGIAVAFMLAILDSDSIAHPRVEAVITVEEETGMDGARAIDLGLCKGKRMLNLDSEEEGIFLTSCAGGARIHGILPAKAVTAEGILYRIVIEGLQGGHSGGEIHKERGNSNCLAGRLLYLACRDAGACLESVQGGLADNAIPRQTEMGLVVEPADKEKLEAVLAGFRADIQKELATKDPGVTVRIAETSEGEFEALSQEDSRRAAFLLLTLPNGVQSMSADIPGLVQTSLNLGILRLAADGLHLDYSVRSSVGSEKELLIQKVTALLASQGGQWEISGEYPAWEYRKDSPLREKMIAVYKRMFQKEPRVEAIHAGLECGILSSKIEGLDCVSIGPDMRDIHTTEEKLSISSTERVWEYVLAVLAQKD